jgi:DNA-binding FadR family transcriptional regulator
MSTEFEQIRIEPAYRKVAAALLARIVDRSLAAGDRLPPETELARQFGVNRSTVREALRELESGGLVGRQRGSKLMVVTRPEHQLVAGGVSRALALHDVTFMDVWEALLILEAPLAEAAARRRKEEDLRRLLEAAGRFGQTQAVHEVADFFRCLGEATHNPALMLAQEPLIQLLEPSLGAMIDRVPQARSRIVTAQGKICEAVRTRDAATAGSWMAKHIRDFKKGYEVAKISLHHRVSVE